jgi:succinoglycan biosynthesis transport protein ExoP
MELKKYWEILWRRKWIFLQAVGVIVLVTLICIIFMKPIYKATAKIKINMQDISVQFISPQQGTGVSNMRTWLPTDLGKVSFTEAANAIATFQAMIENTGSVNTVIRELNLKQTDNLIKIRDRSNEFIEVRDFINPNILEIIKQRKGVEISPVSISDIFEINGFSSSPEEAVNIANKIAGSFLNFLKDLNRQKVIQTFELMEKEALRINSDLTAAEKTVEDFRKTNYVINLNDQRTALIAHKSRLEDVLYDTQQSLTQKKSDLQGLKDALLKQPEFKTGQVSIEDNRLLESYKNTLFGLEVSMAKALSEMTPNHPEVKEIQKQIEQVKVSIEKELTKAFASRLATQYFDTLISKYGDIEIQIVSLRAEEVVLREQIINLIRELSDIPSKELELQRLTRNVDALNASYTVLLGQMEMAKIAKDMDVVNATIIENASVTPSDLSNYIFFPKKVITAILSLFLGTSFGLFLVFLLEYLDDTIRSSEEVTEVLERPVVGIIPRFPKGASALDIRRAELSPLLANWFLDLRSGIKLTAAGERVKTLSVVSVKKDEGKTTISTYLAIVCSQQSGERVLLIDGNLRGHNITEGLNLSSAVGLSSFLEGHVRLDEIIQSGPERLDIISSGPLPSNPLKILESVAMHNLIEDLKERYDLILVDTPAIDVGNDAISISRYCDKVLLVIASGESSGQKIKRVIESFKIFRVPLLGVIFNKAKTDEGAKLK